MKKLVTMATVIALAGFLLTTGPLAQTATTPDEPTQPRSPARQLRRRSGETSKAVNAPLGLQRYSQFTHWCECQETRRGKILGRLMNFLGSTCSRPR